jgi:hypothetical protein
MASLPLRAKSLLLCGLLIATVSTAATARANSIAVWNFNDQDLLVDRGAGTLTTNTSGNSFSSGTIVNADNGDAAGKDLTVSGSTNNSKGFLFTIDLTGYINPTLNYATQRSSSGFTTQSWAYSTDGGMTFTPTTVVSPDTTYSTKSVDLSALAHYSGTVEFTMTLAGGTSSGNNRFDNIVFSGDALPAAPLPPAAAMGFAALLGTALWRKVRR